MLAVATAAPPEAARRSRHAVRVRIVPGEVDVEHAGEHLRVVLVVAADDACAAHSGVEAVVAGERVADRAGRR